MKKRGFLIALILLVGVTCWFISRRAVHEKPGSATTGEELTGESSDSGKVARNHTLKRNQRSVTETAQRANFDRAVSEFVEKSKADPTYEWTQPINFYGKVLDESEQPVGAATISFKWNDLSEEGTSMEQAISDASGTFALQDKKGKRLYVEVSKDGYYTSRQTPVAFEYANPADGLFTPNRDNPVIYHLRKRGPGTDLITSQYGAQKHLGITMPLDGTSVQVDLLRRKIGQGELKMSQVKPTYETWKQATNWVFRMEIPDGGFTEYAEEFPFEAPEGGYQPVAEFDFRAEATNWVTNLRKDYYVKFGNPARYGRIHLETSILMSGARLTYFINPDGSRYLESK